MPQASEYLRRIIKRRFGSLDSLGPERYLKRRGWKLSENWTWSKRGQTLGTMPRVEFECVLFLAHEWDYGGIEKRHNKGLKNNQRRTQC